MGSQLGKEMSKDSHKIVGTWEKIAEYTPFTEQVLRKRFGKEMLTLGVVFKNNMPGRKRRGQIIWGIVWNIEKYMSLKAKRGKLGLYRSKKNQVLLDISET